MYDADCDRAGVINKVSQPSMRSGVDQGLVVISDGRLVGCCKFFFLGFWMLAVNQRVPAEKAEKVRGHKGTVHTKNAKMTTRKMASALKMGIW